MKIVITGANGQLGRTLVNVLGANPRYDILPLGREELDVTDEDATRRVIRSAAPDAVIYAAAYTAVDQAEAEPEAAYRVNAFGVRNAAAAAEEMRSKFLYVSTDYVFDGRGRTPYLEFDELNPLSVYGKSKKAGEFFAQTLCSRFFIVRTSWLYSEYGKNFVKTMLDLAEKQSRLNVVHDQTGSPTYAADLAAFLGELVATERYGIYHAANAGSCTWYEFAKAIFELAGLSVELQPCTTEEFPRPAPRPQYSVLGSVAMKGNQFEPLRDWRAALQDFMRRRG